MIDELPRSRSELSCAPIDSTQRRELGNCLSILAFVVLYYHKKADLSVLRRSFSEMYVCGVHFLHDAYQHVFIIYIFISNIFKYDHASLFLLYSYGTKLCTKIKLIISKIWRDEHWQSAVTQRYDLRRSEMRIDSMHSSESFCGIVIQSRLCTSNLPREAYIRFRRDRTEEDNEHA